MTPTEAWAAETRRKGRCAMPGCSATWSAWRFADDRLEGHHLVPARYLKRVARDRGLDKAAADRLVWNLANHMALCGRHHNRHERALERVPVALLSSDAVEFAEQVGLTWLLDRLYDGGVAA